ncbi:hypothetical protein FRB95_003481 [Tulasnella sp. JGI-2019a]|nr:hypothetical protein FRB95_003481 [Tulasnella sp. JGI-2019a]
MSSEYRTGLPSIPADDNDFNDAAPLAPDGSLSINLGSGLDWDWISAWSADVATNPNASPASDSHHGDEMTEGLDAVDTGSGTYGGAGGVTGAQAQNLTGDLNYGDVLQLSVLASSNTVQPSVDTCTDTPNISENTSRMNSYIDACPSKDINRSPTSETCGSLSVTHNCYCAASSLGDAAGWSSSSPPTPTLAVVHLECAYIAPVPPYPYRGHHAVRGYPGYTGPASYLRYGYGGSRASDDHVRLLPVDLDPDLIRGFSERSAAFWVSIDPTYREKGMCSPSDAAMTLYQPSPCDSLMRLEEPLQDEDICDLASPSFSSAADPAAASIPLFDDSTSTQAPAPISSIDGTDSCDQPNPPMSPRPSHPQGGAPLSASERRELEQLRQEIRKVRGKSSSGRIPHMPRRSSKPKPWDACRCYEDQRQPERMDHHWRTCNYNPKPRRFPCVVKSCNTVCGTQWNLDRHVKKKHSQPAA